MVIAEATKHITTAEAVNEPNTLAGYKQTDVGLIPEDWGLKILSDLTHQIIDGTHHTPHYTEFGVPFLRVTDIQGKDIEISELKYISNDEHRILTRRCKPEKGDILLSKNGTIGIPKIVTWDWEFSIFVSLALLKLKPRKISANYLYQYFKSDYLDQQIRERSKQGTVTNLHLEEIREFLIPVPPTMREQDAIAGALNDADTLIESLESVLAKKREIKKGAIQEFLSGKRRLPGFSEKWHVARFGSVVRIRNEKINTLNTPVSEYCVELENIGQGTGTLSAFNDARGRSSIKYTFFPGDTLFGRLRPYLRKFWQADRSGVCSTEIWPLIPIGSDLVADFLRHIVQTDDFIGVASAAYGTHMPRADWKSLSEFNLRLPPTEAEQLAIGRVLSDMDDDINALERKLTKARQIKQGMMQELLTGRVRLV